MRWSAPCPSPVAAAPQDDLDAAVRRVREAVVLARRGVALRARHATAAACGATQRATTHARATADAEVEAVHRSLGDAVAAAVGAPAGSESAVVPIGRVQVRRHTAATADVEVPLLVPTGSGGVRIVAGEDAMDVVLTLVASLVACPAVRGAASASPLVVVNPRRRPLPTVLLDAPGLREVPDGRGLLSVVGGLGHGAAPLVVLDHPHDLGLAGRRVVHGAAASGRLEPLVVHMDADDPDVDLEHRRLRHPRCGVPHPTGGCELWPARGGWRWSAHPELRVVLRAGGTAQVAPGTGTRGRHPDPRSAVGDGRTADPQVSAGGRPAIDPPSAAEALAVYHRSLDRLAGVARDLDEELARARGAERRALDRAAMTRRCTLEAIDGECRAAELLLRSLPGGRIGGLSCGLDDGSTCTEDIRGAPPRDDHLASLRDARMALGRAVHARKRRPDG